MASLKIKPALILSALLLSSVFCLAEDASEIVGPFGTLNNTDTAFTIPSNKAQDLLNVDISPGGKSVKKRSGYGTAFTLAITTSPVKNVYNFYQTGGSDVSLFFNDTRMASSVGGSVATVLFSTGANGATYQCVDSAGSAYCANTSRTVIVKTDGLTQTHITVNSTGTMVAVTPERLVMAGFSEALNRIDFSKANDFTTWTVGGNPTDPIQFTITAPGSKITHITYAHGRIYWFKDSSFGYILPGPTQADWVVRTVNSFVGSLYNTSVFRDDVLYFQGQDGHFYAWDGSSLQKLSRDIQGLIEVTQGRTTNSWTQSTQTEFQASSITPPGYLNTTISPGSVVLDTAAAISSFADTAAADFGLASSVVGLDTTTVSGSVRLTLNSQHITRPLYGVANNTTLSSEACTSPNYLATSFTATFTYLLNGIELQLQQSGTSGNLQVTIVSDNSAAPTGSVLGTSIIYSTNVAATTSFGFYGSSFSPAIPLTSGVRYWVKLIPLGTCDSSNRISWWRFPAFGPPVVMPSTEYGAAGSSISATNYYRCILYGSSYTNSGNFVSRAFDVGFTTNSWLWSWSNFTATAQTPTSTTLTYETQTSADATSWNSLTSVVSPSTPTSTVQRYIRYKASFATTATSTSATLSDITLAMTTRLRPNATFYSRVNNAANLTSWDAFEATYQNNSGGNAFKIRAATGTFSVGSSTPSTWTPITPGSIPSISTGSYFQIADNFTATAYTNNPKLDDFTVKWFEGSASDKTHAIYNDNALWWAVASGTGATTNNRVLKLDLLNQGWLVYDIPINGMLVRNQSLYFGSPTTGTVYKFGDATSDNGSAINAYWKSKDYFGVTPFLDKDYKRLSLSYLSVSNSTMTVTYTVNGSSSSVYTVPVTRGASSFGNNNRNLPQGTIGTTFNLKFGNNAADQPFEVFGAQLDYTTKSWVPQ